MDHKGLIHAESTPLSYNNGGYTAIIHHLASTTWIFCFYVAFIRSYSTDWWRHSMEMETNELNTLAFGIQLLSFLPVYHARREHFSFDLNFM